MNVLLDTHILLWALVDTKQLSKTAVDVIYAADNIYFSPVNLWEIGIKSSIWAEYGIRRLEDIHAGALRANFQEMVIDSADTMLASQLPMIHRDPFDRLLMAQSNNNRCHLLTVDSKIAQYLMSYVMVV